MLKDEALTYQIRRAIFEVNSQLGPGFLESVYQRSLAIELLSAGLKVETEKSVNIYYKKQALRRWVWNSPPELSQNIASISAGGTTWTAPRF